MTKRIVSILTAVMLFCSMAMPIAAAEETVYLDGAARPASSIKTYGDFLYYVRPDGTIALADYLAHADFTKTHVDIPAYIDGKAVTRLGAAVFYSPSTEIPPEDEFGTCEYIYDPNPIKTVSIPNTVTEMGNYIFGHCENLISVNIPDSVSEFGYSMFLDCTALETVRLSQNIKRLDGTFRGCTNLKEIHIPKSVKTLSSPFVGCPNVKVTLDKENPYIACKGNVLFSEDGTQLLLGLNGVEGKYVVPKGVKKIGIGAFQGNTKIKEIVLPKGIQRIGPYAFYCTKIKRINFPDTITHIGVEAFSGCPISEVVIPSGIKSIAQFAFSFNSSLKRVTVKRNAKIPEMAFYGCSNLKTIRIEKGAKLGSYSFGFADDLDYVYEGVKIYGYKNSTAHRYAKKNGIKFIPLTSLQKAKVKNIKAKKYTKTIKKSGAKQSVKVYVKGKKLKKGRDYTVSYKNNKKRGKATAIITGINRYDGVIKKTFKIK